MPVWHVSVSLWRYGHQVAYSQIGRSQRREGRKLAAEILEGVGGDLMEFITDPPGNCIHAQKPLTTLEIPALPYGWMDIPAVDERGPVIKLG